MHLQPVSCSNRYSWYFKKHQQLKCRTANRWFYFNLGHQIKSGIYLINFIIKSIRTTITSETNVENPRQDISKPVYTKHIDRPDTRNKLQQSKHNFCTQVGFSHSISSSKCIFFVIIQYIMQYDCLTKIINNCYGLNCRINIKCWTL